LLFGAADVTPDAATRIRMRCLPIAFFLVCLKQLRAPPLAGFSAGSHEFSRFCGAGERRFRGRTLPGGGYFTRE
jgi:hypothetical protein